MFAVRYPIKGTDDNRVYICKAKSVNNKKSKDVIERYESEFALGPTKADRDLFIKNRIKELERLEKELQSEKILVEFDLAKRINTSFDDRKNAGFLFLQKCWSDLGVEGFLNNWVRDNKLKIKYSLNDALRLLTYSRVIDPGSKLYTSTLIDNYAESFKLTLDDLYDALDRIPHFSDKLTKKLSNTCLKKANLVDSDAVYYDCTNFYFEIQDDDNEGGLRAHGVEKNHRPDPIVEYGLLFSGNGWPIGCTTFRGNESEKTSLEPLLFAAGEVATRAKIICADAGLNTENNKTIIHNSGRNYIFSQGVKSLSDAAKAPNLSLKAWAINGKDMTLYGTPNRNKEYKSYKARWFQRSSGFEERLVVKFDPDLRDFLHKKINKRVERAQSIIKNPGRFSFKNAQDGKEFIKKIEIDQKTGTIIENSSHLILNQDLIAQAKSEAGYTCYVTDIPDYGDFSKAKIRELYENEFRYKPLSPLGIIKIGGERIHIEQCFKIMKSGMDARPIFVRTPNHITSHLYTVYLGLVLFTFLRTNYKLTLTDEELFAALRNFSFAKIQDNLYKIAYFDKSIEQLIAKTGLNDLMYQHHNHKTLRKIITNSKNRG